MTRIISLKTHMRGLRAAAAALTLGVLLAGCGEKPDELIASAKTYQANKDHPAAVIQLRNALQQNPNLAEARFLLGESLLATNDDVTAEKELRKALELGYSADAVVPLLARLMIEQGRADEMLKEFGTRHLGAPAAEAALQVAIGDAYAGQDKIKEAQLAYTAALGAQPGYVPARVGEARLFAARGDLEEATRRADAILTEAPQDSFALNLRGALYSIHKQYKEAADTYAQLVAVEPTKYAPRRALIAALIFDNQLDRATTEIAAAKKIGGGNDVPLVYQEALLQMRKRNYAEANEAAQRVLKVLPDHIPSLMVAGAANLYMGSFEPAQDALLKVLNRFPQYDGARRLLVTTYIRSGQPARAVETLEPLLEHPQLDAATLSLAGETYLAAGDLDRAEGYFESAVKLDKENVPLRTRLGQVYIAAGDQEAGISELELAASADASRPQADFLLVMGHMRRKEYDKAEEALKGLEKKQPNNPFTYNVKGNLLANEGDFKGARAAFEHALSLNGDNYTALVNLARLDLKEKQPEAARKRFEAAIAKQPKNDQLMITYAQFMAETGASPESVIAMIERAVKANSDSAPARLALINAKGQSGDKKGMLSAAQDAIAAFPNNPRILEAAGIAQLASGDVNQSISTFNKLVQAQPKSAMALMRLAQAQVAAKSPDAAIESLQKALALQPDAPEVQSMLVDVLVNDGRFDQALAEARKLQTKDPKNAIGYALEGDVQASNKKWAEANSAYAEALKRAPDNTGVFIKSIRVLDAGQRPADVESFGSRWVKAHPKDMAARIYLAERDLREKDYKGAVAHYKVVMEQQPQNVLALNNLAWAASQLKDPAALEYAQKAYELAPKNPAVLDTLGTLLVEKGETDKGLQYLQEAFKLAPQSAEIQLNYAKALIRAGKKEQAKNELQALSKHSDPQVKARAEEMLKTL